MHMVSPVQSTILYYCSIQYTFKHLQYCIKNLLKLQVQWELHFFSKGSTYMSLPVSFQMIEKNGIKYCSLQYSKTNLVSGKSFHKQERRHSHGYSNNKCSSLLHYSRSAVPFSAVLVRSGLPHLAILDHIWAPSASPQDIPNDSVFCFIWVIPSQYSWQQMKATSLDP